MFYTGQTNGGANELPMELAPLDILLENTAHRLNLSEDCSGTDPKNLVQVPAYLLPMTLNEIEMDIQVRSTVDTHYDTKDALDIGGNEYPNVVYIRILKTVWSQADMDADMAFQNLLTQHPAEQMNVRNALVVSNNQNSPPMLIVNKNAIVVLTKKYTPLLLLNLIAMLPYLMKDLFKNAKYPVPNRIFHALGNRNWEAWLKNLLDWGMPIVDVHIERQRTETIRNYFSSFKTNGLEGLEARIREAKRLQTDYMEEYRKALKRERDAMEAYRELSLYERDLTETVDYWLKKKEIVQATLNDRGSITMLVRTPVTNYDEDELRQYLSTKVENDLNKSGQRRNFFTRLFIERTHTLWFSAKVVLDCANRTITRDTSGNDRFFNAIPNTHIDQYDCWGNNKPYILQAIEEMRYETAIEQIIASVANLNFSDPTVIRATWNKITSSDSSQYPQAMAIVENATGKRISIKQFMKECADEANQD